MRNCIGIDVAKQSFDLHCLQTSQDQQMQNSADGIRRCVTLCHRLRPELIFRKATDGYELSLAATLQAKGFALSVVNPRRIRDFDRVAGQMAKTDKLDARIIAQFAAKMEPMTPMARDSGTFRGKRMIGGGRQEIRSRMFMPTLVGVRHNPILKTYYTRLIRRDKCKMVVLVAVMRKLICILNTMARNNHLWNPNFVAFT